MSTTRKLWKVISLSKTHGSRISRNMPYADALNKYMRYRDELTDGDILYMVQVIDVAVGRATIDCANTIEIQAPSFLQGVQ